MGRSRLFHAGVAALALAASGCSSLGLGEAPPPEDVQPQPAPAVAREMAASADDLEIGQIDRGLIFTVYGTAPGPGYFDAQLRPRNNGDPSPDGFLELDFLATPPQPGPDGKMPPLGPAPNRLRADYAVKGEQVTRYRGVRIFTQKGASELVFGPPR